jgi:hypothetical protein
MKWYISCKAWEDDHKVIDLPLRDDVYKSTLDQICHFGQRDGRLVFAVMTTDEEIVPASTCSKSYASSDRSTPATWL